MNVRTNWRPTFVVAVAASLLLAACSSNNSGSSSSASQAASSQASAGAPDYNTVPPKPDFSGSLTADGSTFVQPVMEQWTQDYANQTGIQISYNGGGSGQGIKDVTANTVQFAGTDAAMKPDEQSAAEAKNGPILHIPVVFGGIVLSYNLQGVTDPLNFSPDVIGKIFTGQIKSWDDPAIKADNPSANLPNQAITVVHRSDGSGTTSTFTNWLCLVSADWKAKVNPCAGKEVTWPVGLGGQGNPGVTSTITTTPGAIGYIELAYAIQNKVPYGNVKNKAGNWITPSLDSVAAAAKLATIPDNLVFQPWNTDVSDGYPIVGTTWVLVYQQQDKVIQDQGAAAAIVHFLLWAVDSGAADAKALDYAVLPDNLKAAVQQKLATITWNGQSILDSLYK